MKILHQTPNRTWRCVALVLVSLAMLVVARAQPAATGTIDGRIYNPATGEYVRNAEVRLQGTNRVVETEADGSFTLTNVPPGNATLEVTYIGTSPVTKTVNVTSGTTAVANINIGTAPNAEGPIKMAAFTVSSEKEGNAKAIMDEKTSMNVSNIVAAENFGDTSEGNVGEFLKYLPGVELDYVEADARSPRIRGLPAQFTTVTFAGMDLASADGFIENNGTDNGGGAGAGGRSFGFEQVSMSSVDAVDVSFTTNASQPASSAAGSIDLMPKHAYQRSGQRIGLNLSAQANSEEFFWHKVIKPDDRARRLVMPNGSFEYSNSFLNHRLGVIFSVNETNFFNEQRQFQPNYDTKTTPTDPRPWVLTRIQFKDGPKLTERSTFSFTLDYRLTHDLTLSLIGTMNNYGMLTSNRSFGVNAKRSDVVGNGQGDWTNVPVTVSNSEAYLRKRTHGYSYVPTIEYRHGNVLWTGAAAISTSENNYAGGQSKSLPGNNLGGVGLPATGIRVNASHPVDNLYAWNVVQVAGPDWSNLANYTASPTSYPTFGFDGRYNRVLKYQAKTDARITTPLSIPTWVKVGANVAETTYIFRNPTNWQSWNYVGPGGGLGGSWADYPSQAIFAPGHGASLLSSSGQTAAIIDHNTVGDLFATHPEYFVHNDSPANYISYLNSEKYIREQLDALYAMVDTKPFRRLELQAGVRWERTRDETKDFQVLSPKQMPAQYPVNTTGKTDPTTKVPSGYALTVPGITYQFLSQPRAAHSNRYDKLFPSGGIKFDLTPNTQALFGYTYSITRPAYGDLSGAYTVDDESTPGRINVPNTKLQPEYSNNYTLRVTHYTSGVGKFGIGIFENDIRSYFENVTLQGVAAEFGYTDPMYADYEVTTKYNVPGTEIYRGATVDYQQSLNFLPRPFNGLTVFANYTRTYVRAKVSDPSQLHASGSPYNYGWFSGYAPHRINAGVSWQIGPASFRVNGQWTSEMPTTGTYNTWMRENLKLDVSASYRINRYLTAYLSSRNITNQPDITYRDGDYSHIGGGRAWEYYGAYIYAGVKATF